ncbi:glycerophosphoryl diester phosphodiesterase [Haliangium ochraceum DSM 14365]|uniref:Glycerophosphoryl diester phosphodiesterase n=1 Tax=Haliangium ochraceum (strain DSM 14365 / JCM 11303 / SMP-2) TaxID=502025 RepID=D0LXI5_HALO1|nr:glycerophosphoryl diester phosphodiesterase [Haliangium ochraceum DSM 14365]
MSQTPLVTQPVFYAHRGAAAEQPENTLPAFARALELGADVLETDVHLSADGHVVISHDPVLTRMAGVAVPVRRAQLARIRELDAGFGFVDARGQRPFEGRGYRIPTLEEALLAFPDTPFNVDIKQPGTRIVRAVLDLLRRLRASERVVLASFHYSTLLAVRGLGFAGRTSMARQEVATLYATPKRAYRRLPLTGQMVQIPVKAGPVRLDTPRFLAKCHALGLRVDYWTINDPAEARRLLDLGADGIMTDDPEAIAPVFAERRG